MDFMPESMAGTNRDRAHQIISGKLTDHQRPNGSPFAAIETTSSSYNYYTAIQSPLILSEEEEEEDMANCLIMLAHSVSVSPNQLETISTKSSSDNYECKTCNRSFQSFQALGGHRASHKKTKLTVHEITNSVLKQKLVHDNKTITHNIIKSSSPSPGFIQTGYKLINSKGKVHECSICGSEFLSGQALGGHMRRHRTTPPSTNQMNYTSSHQNTEKSRVLCLDLNLPAPDVVEDVHSMFDSSQQPLGFSATALVDCHY